MLGEMLQGQKLAGFWRLGSSRGQSHAVQTMVAQLPQWLGLHLHQLACQLMWPRFVASTVPGNSLRGVDASWWHLEQEHGSTGCPLGARYCSPCNPTWLWLLTACAMSQIYLFSR